MKCDWCKALLDIYFSICQGTMGCHKTCKVEKLLRQSQREVVWSQRQTLARAKKNSWVRGTDKVSVACCLSVCWLLSFQWIRFNSVWTLGGSEFVDACSHNLTSSRAPQTRFLTATEVIINKLSHMHLLIIVLPHIFSYSINNITA